MKEKIFFSVPEWYATSISCFRTKQYRTIPEAHQQSIDDPIIEWKEMGVKSQSMRNTTHQLLQLRKNKMDLFPSNLLKNASIYHKYYCFNRGWNEWYPSYGDAVFFSVVDLKAAYLQILSSHDPRGITSFNRMDHTNCHENIFRTKRFI